MYMRVQSALKACFVMVMYVRLVMGFHFCVNWIIRCILNAAYSCNWSIIFILVLYEKVKWTKTKDVVCWVILITPEVVLVRYLLRRVLNAVLFGGYYTKISCIHIFCNVYKVLCRRIWLAIKDFTNGVWNNAFGIQFLWKLLFTDETRFTRIGICNFHKVHIWAHARPTRSSRGQTSDHIPNVWAGIFADRLIGKVRLPERLTRITYRKFFERLMQDILPDLLLSRIRQYLNDHFPGKWIGRNGPVDWPPSFPGSQSYRFLTLGPR